MRNCIAIRVIGVNLGCFLQQLLPFWQRQKNLAGTAALLSAGFLQNPESFTQ